MIQRLIVLFFLVTLVPVHALEWSPVQSNTEEILTDISFSDPSTGYACGTFGTLLKSRDGGQRWERLKSPSGVSFTAIEAIDAQRVFCGRRSLYRTEDGGENWTEVEAFSEGGASIFSIEFVSESTGFLIKSGYIYRTRDGGHHWESVFAEDNEYFLDRLYTPEENVIVATGGFTRSEFFGFTSVGFVLRSDDGGDSWTLLDTTGIPEIMAAAWMSASHGMVFTHAGTVFQTLDGGERWEALATNLSDLGNPLITAVRFVDTQVGYAVSYDGKMIRTADGGLTWLVEAEASTKNGGVPLGAMALVGGKTVIGAGNEGLIFRREGVSRALLPRVVAIDYHSIEGMIEITVRGSPGVPFRLESSQDLRSPWTVESIQIPVESPWKVSVPSSGGVQRYYRLAADQDG